VSEVPRGLASGWDLGYQHGLTRHIAMELALGLRLSGRRAYEVGLVNRLVAKDDLIGASIELARQLCALPRATLVANRALVDALVPMVPEPVVARAEEQRQRIVESPEARAAFLGFAEKHSD
jgi:enoyl-CoA hydratase/carnithine racemase